MAVERGPGSLDIQVEVKALAGRGLGHLALHLAGALDGHPVLLGQADSALALALSGSGRIELKAPPGDSHVVTVLEAVERGLEATLPDVAPGAGNVRPDFDVH